MLKVISLKICPFVQRITALLEAKGIPYEIDYISLSAKPAWFLELSPHGQVPLLVTESGLALFESDAIAEYLDDIYSPLQEVSAETRALDRAWVHLGVKNYMVQCGAQRSSDEVILAERADRLGVAFGKMESVLGCNYFRGDNLSNVDIAWLPILHRSLLIRDFVGYDFLANFPKMQNWRICLEGTGLFSRSVAVDFEDIFTGYYLSDETYLGRLRVLKNA